MEGTKDFLSLAMNMLISDHNIISHTHITQLRGTATPPAGANGEAQPPVDNECHLEDTVANFSKTMTPCITPFPLQSTMALTLYK